jgi:tetratricopeptide (TPR) repeat protein
MKKIVLLLLISHLAHAGEDPRVVYKNNQAEKLFKEDHILDSKNILQKEVVDHPDKGELHFNLGLAHELSQEPDKAAQEYGITVRSTKDRELQFKSLFNIARLFGEKGDLKNALKYYQLALELNPDSEEVKTNIELLFQQNSGKNNSQSKDQKKENKDDKNQQQQSQGQKNDQEKQNKQQPQQFKSKDLSERDVQRILDELKRQEEQIRAKINNDQHKESPVEKDW